MEFVVEEDLLDSLSTSSADSVKSYCLSSRWERSKVVGLSIGDRLDELKMRSVIDRAVVVWSVEVSIERRSGAVVGEGVRGLLVEQQNLDLGSTHQLTSSGAVGYVLLVHDVDLDEEVMKVKLAKEVMCIEEDDTMWRALYSIQVQVLMGIRSLLTSRCRRVSCFLTLEAQRRV